MKSLLLLTMIGTFSGCVTVVGYVPTQSEADALSRGEDPRADEPEYRATKRKAATIKKAEVKAVAGPESGVVLRWIDSDTLVIEVDEALETVRIPDALGGNSSFEDDLAKSERMNDWTYGETVHLEYPKRDAKGGIIYRDSDGYLIATLR